ncbi:MAG TPA: LysR substrate-binding domain-containing protein [Burkholderiaceae bacterium]|nr:LysR substrate-binding domain-containing protein [Burkholderiaceae bacterium]
MPDRRNVLTPDALTMMDVIARTGSFAAAARELGKVPSSLTYSVRQLEDALDVLLFDRRSRQARLTPAGEELLNEGRRLLEQLDAVANRVQRVATGWETQLSIAVDCVISRLTMFELCESFYSVCVVMAGMKARGASTSSAAAAAPSLADGATTHTGPGTRLRLRTEVMTGTWEALASGQVDLAIGVAIERSTIAGVQMKELGQLPFVFAIAPHHPLAGALLPLSDVELVRYRAVAVADSAQRMAPATINLLPGQEVLTVSSMQLKIEALLRCMGCGFVPEPMVREHVAAGRLVVKPVQRSDTAGRLGYAWRTPDSNAPGAGRKPQLGQALRWWLGQLDSAATRQALLEHHSMAPMAGM